MPSPYDILINLQAKADEVKAAQAVVSSFIKDVQEAGPALAASMQKGDAATKTAARDLKDASDAAKEVGKQGGAAGAAMASGMGQAGGAVDNTRKKVESLNNETKKHKGLAEEASSAWKNFGSHLLDGITLGFGTELASKGIEALMEIPKLFIEATEKGVEFDREMETSSIGLAATLRSVAPEKYLSFNEARQAGEKAMDALRAKAVQSGTDFRSLVEAYSANLRALVEGGVTRPEQQVELIGTLLSAAASKGVTGMQALRDSIDILNGRASNIVLAKELGLENEALKEAAKNGQLYALIMSKISGYREAAGETAESFAGLQQSVSNLLTQLEGTASVPVFDALKDALKSVKELLSSIEAQGAAKGTGQFLGDLISGTRTVLSLMEQASANSQRLNASRNDESGGYFDAARLAAYQQANDKILQALREQVANATAATDQDLARDAISVRISRTQQEIATSQGVQKTAAEGLLDALVTMQQDFGIIAEKGLESAHAGEELTGALHGANEELSAMLGKLPGLISGLQQAASAASLANRMALAANTAQKVGIMEGEQGNVLGYVADQAKKLGYSAPKTVEEATAVLQDIKARQAAPPTGLPSLGRLPALAGVDDPQAIENLSAGTKRLIELNQQLAGLKRQQSDEDRKSADATSKREAQEGVFDAKASGNKTLADQRERDIDIRQKALEISTAEGVNWDEATRRATVFVDKQNAANDAIKAEKGARKEAAGAAREQHQVEMAADKDRQTALLEIRDQIQEIQKNPFLTNAQKEQGEKPLLEAELALLRQNIAEREKLIALYGTDPKHAADAARLRQENVRDQHTANEAGQQLRGMTFVGDLKKQTVELQNQWGTTSHAIASDITSTIGTAVNGVGSAISGWLFKGKSFLQSVEEIGESIIEMLINIAVQQTVGRALVYAVNLAFGTAEQATVSAQAASATAAWATPAALAATASYGSAAAAAPAAVAAAIGAVQGIAAAGSIGGLEEGGVVPGRPSNRDNVLMRMATGEFVTRTKAVGYYGTELLHAINDMRVPRGALLAALSGMPVARSGLADGGLVGGGNYSPILLNSSPSVKVKGGSLTLIQPRSRSEILDALASSEGEALVVNHVIRRKMKIGIPS